MTLPLLLIVVGLGLFAASALLWQGWRRRRRRYSVFRLRNMPSPAWRDREKPDGV